MEPLSYIIPSEAEMLSLGRCLALHLTPGTFIALFGDLGAGKTALSRGIGEGLGTYDISSPTFTIVHEHNTSPLLFHFDAYRLDTSDELYDIGFDDYISQNGIILMEWPERVPDALPKQRLDITIRGSGMQERIVTFTPYGESYQSILDHMRRDFPCAYSE